MSYRCSAITKGRKRTETLAPLRRQVRLCCCTAVRDEVRVRERMCAVDKAGASVCKVARSSKSKVW